MTSSLDEQHCKTLHQLSTAPKDEYIAIINQSDSPLFSALVEILLNFDLFCDQADKKLIGFLLHELRRFPDSRVQLLAEHRKRIQSILGIVFREALLAEAVVAVLNYGSSNACDSRGNV